MTRFSPMGGGDSNFCNGVTSQLQPCDADAQSSCGAASSVLVRLEVYYA